MIENPPSLVVKGYRIAPELFTKGYAFGCGPWTCTSFCCSGGVYTDIRERDRILANRDLIKEYMDDTQSTDESLWFEEEEDDPDFPSGRRAGTRVVNEKCAFLDAHGSCSIQRATTAEGTGRWALKPLYCILYPVEISDHEIGFDPMLQNEQACCTVSDGHDIPVFEACRDELVHVLGEDGFQVLRAHYETLYQSSQRGV